VTLSTPAGAADLLAAPYLAIPRCTGKYAGRAEGAHEAEQSKAVRAASLSLLN
jgi:hypothetical protein